MTKKIITLSLIASSMMFAAETELSTINVESTVITEVAKKAQTSADLADVLSKNIPSVDMNRRSSIANDVIIRGQKRDNISVEIDGTKVCGACPNRMDPPVSHVLASQIEDIEVTEGPYDVTSFGTMSGGLKIKTKAPKKGFESEVKLGLGAFGYQKMGATVSGGNDFVRALASVTSEKSDQYEDGDGNTLAEQIENKAVYKNQYHDDYKDMEAYTKQSAMVKLFVNPMENHELRLSVTANRSDDVMYANSSMDAIKDDSNLYSAEYNIDNLSNMYKNLNFQYYYTEVEHPMSTIYRKQAQVDVFLNPMAMSMTNDMKSEMNGLKLKNTFMLDSYEVLVGLDGSSRMWSGMYINDITGADKFASIDETTTDNIAVFTKVDKTIGDIDLTFGLRFDSTEITNKNSALESNDYTGINANVVANYNLTENSKMFFGFGQAQRVPDARELYFINGMTGAIVGTTDLEQTTNRQFDLGYETNLESFNVKVKAFYSMLSDYIYYQKGQTTSAFKNIDATIYGTELTASYFPMDEMWIDASMAYKKGEKDEALAGQTDTDLADIAPLRTTLAVNYEYMDRSTATLEIQASAKWSDFDADNGEQELDEWSIINLKADHTFSDMINMTVGVNNVLDETFAMSNTYADLTLLAAGTGDIVLLNEPGRYIYTNLNLKF